MKAVLTFISLASMTVLLTGCGGMMIPSSGAIYNVPASPGGSVVYNVPTNSNSGAVYNVPANSNSGAVYNVPANSNSGAVYNNASYHSTEHHSVFSQVRADITNIAHSNLSARRFFS